MSRSFDRQRLLIRLISILTLGLVSESVFLLKTRRDLREKISRPVPRT
jgi:hypothetical protein